MLACDIGEFAVVARQRRGGGDWWICGVTNHERREVPIDLSFLPEGKRYTAEIWRDGEGGGIEGNRFAMVRETREVRGGDTLTLAMEAGGGFALSLRSRE